VNSGIPKIPRTAERIVPDFALSLVSALGLFSFGARERERERERERGGGRALSR